MVNNKLIFVNGCFDILHTGHLDLLEYAASLGNYLIVAVDSDERIKNSKGANRPINTCLDRVRMLSALSCVDSVLYFNSDKELRNIVIACHPDIMVKGADYKNKSIIGAEFCGEIKFVELNGQSTSQKIQSLSTR